MREPDGSGENVIAVPPPTILPVASSTTIDSFASVSVCGEVSLTISPSTSPTQPRVVLVRQDRDVGEVRQDARLRGLERVDLDRHLEVRTGACVRIWSESPKATVPPRGSAATVFVTVPISSPLAVAKLISR